MSIKSALSGGGALVAALAAVAALVVGGIGGYQAGDDGPAAGTGEGELVAVAVCRHSDLVVTKVIVPSGNYFTARWEEPGLRYDLTWQEGGTSIAVERSQGQEFDPWSEQMTPEFQSCIAGHQVTIKEGTH